MEFGKIGNVRESLTAPICMTYVNDDFYNNIILFDVTMYRHTFLLIFQPSPSPIIIIIIIIADSASLGALFVVGIQERTVLDGVRAVAGTVAVSAAERPELGTRGAHRVPHQMAAVHLGRFAVLVAERAVVLHQLVDGAAVGVHAVVDAGGRR